MVWAALAVGLGSASSALAQPDPHTQWLEQPDDQVLSWVASHTRSRSEEVLWTQLDRAPSGAATVVQRGVTMEDERATGVFERRVAALDFRVDPPVPQSSADIERCRAQLERCSRSARQCTAEVRLCVFGRQTLARGGGAELVLEHPPIPMELRSGEREAMLRWHGQERRVRIPFNNPIDGPNDGHSHRPQLTVQRLSPRREALVMQVQEPGDEDPPSRFQYFVLRAGSLREIRDPTVARFTYDSRLPGDGTIVVDENPWTTCQRLDYPERAPRSRVVVRVSDQGLVRSARRQRRPGHWECRELPACPFVDRVDATGGLRRLGEILRNVRRVPESQELAVGLSEAVVRLRVAEEKPEVTHLDAVWLRIGDVDLHPLACDGASPPSYCRRDGRSLRLEEGETLELEFAVPRRLRDCPAFLGAHGMYVPVE